MVVSWKPAGGTRSRLPGHNDRSAVLMSCVLIFMLLGGVAHAQDRITLAALPCTQLLASYGTDRGGSWLISIYEDVSRMDKAGLLGSNANIMDYVLTECRLNEGFTVGQAVFALFSAANSHNLPPVPIGGATAERRVQAERQQYERWLKHQGPKPRYAHDR
jgi:hypothetical protein